MPEDLRKLGTSAQKSPLVGRRTHDHESHPVARSVKSVKSRAAVFWPFGAGFFLEEVRIVEAINSAASVLNKAMKQLEILQSRAKPAAIRAA